MLLTSASCLDICSTFSSQATARVRQKGQGVLGLSPPLKPYLALRLVQAWAHGGEEMLRSCQISGDAQRAVRYLRLIDRNQLSLPELYEQRAMREYGGEAGFIAHLADISRRWAWHLTSIFLSAHPADPSPPLGPGYLLRSIPYALQDLLLDT